MSDKKHSGTRRLKPENMTPRERKVKLAAYLESQRGRPAIRPAPRAARSIARIVSPLSKKFGPGAAGLMQFWPQIAGPKLSKVSKPVRVQNSKDGATLIVNARGPAATLLQANAATIMSAANTYLGQGSIVRLKVVQSQMGAASETLKPSASRAGLKANRKIVRRAQPQTRGLTPSEKAALHKGLSSFDRGDLRTALEALGEGMIKRQVQNAANLKGDTKNDRTT